MHQRRAAWHIVTLSNARANNSYDYTNRDGIRPVSWDQFHGLTKALAAAVAPWRPQIILPVLRGGAYPGMLLSHILRVDVYPIRLSRREVDDVVRESPVWLIEPPAAVAGRRVLIVDEMCSTGETLTVARRGAIERGAAGARVAALYAHTWGTDAADYIGLITDELIMNPWDREIFREGGFALHPEYAAALAEQGIAVGPSFLIPAAAFVVAKTTPAES